MSRWQGLKMLDLSSLGTIKLRIIFSDCLQQHKEWGRFQWLVAEPEHEMLLVSTLHSRDVSTQCNHQSDYLGPIVVATMVRVMTHSGNFTVPREGPYKGLLLVERIAKHNDYNWRAVWLLKIPKESSHLVMIFADKQSKLCLPTLRLFSIAS